jgi:ornithine cyclodeaminase/alanine dehydrogenase-like protein (mu-crystallin family)
MPILYLTESDVRSLLTMDDALASVEAAFLKLALDEATTVPRQRCQTDAVMLHVLPAAARTLGALGYKAYTTGRFGAKFYVHLFDPKHGEPTAILEADHLGAVRTGAASGVATKLLARPDAATVGLIGTGKQARTQLEAMCKVRPVTKAVVYGRDEARRKQFAAEMMPVCGVEVVPAATAEEAVRGHDILATATNARDPVLLGRWVADGAHVNLIGSNFLSRAEADVDLFRRAKLVTIDSKDQGRAEAGDFTAALNAGVLHWSDVKELAPVLVGRYPGRQSADEITVFKSLGLGVEDIAVAVRVVELAKAKGVGKALESGTP